MKRLVLLIVLIIIIISAGLIFWIVKWTNHYTTEVIYKYKDVCVKRIDSPGKTIFYYEDKIHKEAGMIWTTYSGIDSFFECYLKFTGNNKVLIIVSDGYFQSKNIDKNRFNYRYYSYDEDPELIQKYWGDSICVACYPIEREKKINSEQKTKVNIFYNDNGR